MITKEKRSLMVRYWWSKAEESLASARREFEAGSFSFSMNRLYYAAFYGVSALLMEHDLSFKKHSGVRTLLSGGVPGASTRVFPQTDRLFCES